MNKPTIEEAIQIAKESEGKEVWHIKFDAYMFDYIAALINPEVADKYDLYADKQQAIKFFEKMFEENELYTAEFRDKLFKNIT